MENDNHNVTETGNDEIHISEGEYSNSNAKVKFGKYSIDGPINILPNTHL